MEVKAKEEKIQFGINVSPSAQDLLHSIYIH